MSRWGKDKGWVGGLTYPDVFDVGLLKAKAVGQKHEDI